jgi:acyl carrier protein
MEPSITDKILEILAEQAVLKVADIRIESTLDELGIDSLGLVETVFAIEEEFDVEVPFNANDGGAIDGEQAGFDLSNVGALVKAVERLVANK